MSAYSKAFSGFSVDDLQKAKAFYHGLLGIAIKEEMGLELQFEENYSVFIYEKKNHSPATFTVLNLVVDNIEKAVADLTNKGIRFEHYEGDIKTDEKGIFRGQGPLIAWFKDPAGNILSVLEEKEG